MTECNFNPFTEETQGTNDQVDAAVVDESNVETTFKVVESEQPSQ